MKRTLIALGVTLVATGALSGAHAQSSSDPGRSEQSAYNGEINGFSQATEKWRQDAVSVPNVVIFDTGVRPSDDTKFAGGYNYVDLNEDYRDPTPADGVQCPQGHGLAIASIIGAKANNGVGITGISEANLYMARVVNDSCGASRDPSALETLTTAFQSLNAGNSPIGISASGIDVVMVSHPIKTACPTSLQEVIDGFVDVGITVIAPSGTNEGGYAEDYTPGNCNNVITVSAHDDNGDIAGSSEAGPSVDLLSHGVWYTETNSGQYDNLSGSAAAAASIAGSASFLKSLYGDAISPAQIETILKTTASPHTSISCDGLCGSGVHNLQQAVMFSESVIEPIQAYNAEPDNIASLTDKMLEHVLDDESACRVDARIEAFEGRPLCNAFKVNTLAPDVDDNQFYRVVVEKKPDYVASWNDDMVSMVRTLEPASENGQILFYHEPNHDYRVSYCAENPGAPEGETDIVCPFPVDIDASTFNSMKPADCQ